MKSRKKKQARKRTKRKHVKKRSRKRKVTKKIKTNSEKSKPRKSRSKQKVKKKSKEFTKEKEKVEADPTKADRELLDRAKEFYDVAMPNWHVNKGVLGPEELSELKISGEYLKFAGFNSYNESKLWNHVNGFKQGEQSEVKTCVYGGQDYMHMYEETHFWSEFRGNFSKELEKQGVGIGNWEAWKKEFEENIVYETFLANDYCSGMIYLTKSLNVCYILKAEPMWWHRRPFLIDC